LTVNIKTLVVIGHAPYDVASLCKFDDYGLRSFLTCYCLLSAHSHLLDNQVLCQALFFSSSFNSWMAREEAAAFHLIASGFQSVLFIDSGPQIGLVVFF
jgi:hypothetical protein